MFVYDNNKDSFVQTNLPGISGYGQKGSQGDKGDLGGSMYFTPYNMNSEIDDASVFKEFKYCIDTTGEEPSPFWTLTDGLVQKAFEHGATPEDDVKAIRSSAIIDRKMFSSTKSELSEELSNNPDYKNEGVFYNWITDGIIDVNGDVYELVKWAVSAENETSAGRFQKTHNLFKSSLDTGITVDASVVTTFNDATQPSSYKQLNKYYMGYEKTPAEAYRCAPQTYYRGYYKEYTYGNVIKVTVNNVDYSRTNYNFKYVVCLPCGERLEKYSKSNVEHIFIDNRYLYGCCDTVMSSLHTHSYVEDSPEFTQNYAKLLYTHTVDGKSYSPTFIYVEMIDMNDGTTSIVSAETIKPTAQ